MGTSFTPELIRLLIASGCHFERHGKGDHDIWYSPMARIHTRLLPLLTALHKGPSRKLLTPTSIWAT
jgi:hypothetical protein